MELFQVGFYKDVFKNGAFDFKGCEEIEAVYAIDAAQEFAMNQYYDFNSDMNGVSEPWDAESHSVMVKDKDGDINKFSVYVSMEPYFKCEFLIF